MSIQFSDTTNYQGIIQRIEDTCGFNPGDISGNTTLLKKFTAKINAYQNKAWAIIIPASGTWQWDDNNHLGDPYLFRDIASGTQKYHWLKDTDGNFILDFHRVAIKRSATATTYDEIFPIDVQSSSDSIILNGSTQTGVPGLYEKLGNGLVFDVVPSYSATNGIKVFVNREGYYFTTTDTTKNPGFAGLFHEYLVLGPSYEWIRDKSLPNLVRVERDMMDMEKAMKVHYSQREKDVRKIMSGKKILYI